MGKPKTRRTHRFECFLGCGSVPQNGTKGVEELRKQEVEFRKKIKQGYTECTCFL